MKKFDIAPFALPQCPQGEIRFEEPRDIERVEVTFSGAPPRNPSIEYLRRIWPGERFERSPDADQLRPAPYGWMRIDDHFHSEWTRAATDLKRECARTVAFTFKGLRTEMKGSAGAAGYDVLFRRTLGVRIVAGDAAIRRVSVFTRSQPARSRLRVELDAGKRTPTRTLEVAGYNAVVRAVAAGPGLWVAGTKLRRTGRRGGTFTIDVTHMEPAHRHIYDDGLLTFALDRDMFTVSLTSLRAQGPIWYAEQGVFITDAGDSTTFAEYRKSIRGKQTVAQDVVAMQEQSLSGARNGQPRPHPIPYCFGCTHSRQKFWIEPNGDIDLISWFVKVPEGRDSPRWKNENTARFMFGLGRWSVDGRFNDPWPVMAYNIRMKRGDLLLHQKAFAVPLQSSILAGEPRPDDTIVALVRFRFENTGDEAVPAAIKVA